MIAGAAIAVSGTLFQAVLKRNHTIMELLVSLGVEKEIAEEDACKMEHIISQQSLAALGLLLEGRLNKTF